MTRFDDADRSWLWRAGVRLFTLLGVMLAHAAAAAPRANLWPRWQAHDDASTQVIDERGWGEFLKAYLHTEADGINRVAYGAVTTQARAALEADVERLQQAPVSKLSQAEQRPYWTNLYNEVTVMVVLQHYPIASITKIDLSPGLFAASGPWDAKLLVIENQHLSLNDIEHRILRPIWRDPRTHYSLNCASLGCPNLQPVPYSRQTMDEMLNRAATEYVNSARGFHIVGGKLTVSSIYTWYKADFGGTDAGVIDQLHRYARPEKAQSLAGITEIAANAYDWRLNDAPGD